jgi:hypothetical protein
MTDRFCKEKCIKQLSFHFLLFFYYMQVLWVTAHGFQFFFSDIISLLLPGPDQSEHLLMKSRVTVCSIFYVNLA